MKYMCFLTDNFITIYHKNLREVVTKKFFCFFLTFLIINPSNQEKYIYKLYFPIRIIFGYT